MNFREIMENFGFDGWRYVGEKGIIDLKFKRTIKNALLNTKERYESNHKFKMEFKKLIFEVTKHTQKCRDSYEHHYEVLPRKLDKKLYIPFVEELIKLEKLIIEMYPNKDLFMAFEESGINQ